MWEVVIEEAGIEKAGIGEAGIQNAGFEETENQEAGIRDAASPHEDSVLGRGGGKAWHLTLSLLLLVVLGMCRKPTAVPVPCPVVHWQCPNPSLPRLGSPFRLQSPS